MQLTMYLTFDDGPSRDYTERLLDLLKFYDIKASFFVVARFAKDNPDIIKRMKREGHLIGLHSLEHRSAYLQTLAYTKRDFAESMDIMENLGVNIAYYRPPWGHLTPITQKHIKKYGLKTVLWDVMAEDWSGYTTVKEIQEKLLFRTGSGDIICLHDGRGKNRAPERMIEALKKVLPIWKARGYQFKRIDERENE